MFLLQRHRKVLTKCRADKRSIFQVHSPICHVSMNDVRALLDATHGMRVQDKKDYFYAHGVDYERVNEYYDTIVRLNRSWQPDVFAEMHDRVRIAYYAFLLMLHFLFSSRNNISSR